LLKTGSKLGDVVDRVDLIYLEAAAHFTDTLHPQHSRYLSKVKGARHTAHGFPPMAEKSKPPALCVVGDSQNANMLKK
jgi:hypothetical protein